MKNSYKSIFNSLVSEYGLSKDMHLGVLEGKNLGDFYYFLSALKYTQEKLSLKFTFFVTENSNYHHFLQAFKNGGAPVDIVIVDSPLLSPANPVAGNVPMELRAIINSHLFFQNKYKQLNQWYRNDERTASLTRPVFEDDPGNEAFAKLGLTGKRVAYVIPFSVWTGTLDTSFWLTQIDMFKLLGYHVVVNAKKEQLPVEGVTYYLPTIPELISFCNNCDVIFGIRSGLTEIIGAETESRLVIVNPYRNFIHDFYPFCKKDKIAYITIPSIRSVGYPYIEKRQNEKVEAHHPFNIFASTMLADKLPIPENKCNVKFYCRNFKETEFGDVRSVSTQFSMSVLYSTHIEACFLFFRYRFIPDFAYEVHIELIEAKTNRIVQQISNITVNPCVFFLEESGTYIIKGKAIYSERKITCRFQTDLIKAEIDIFSSLRYCTNYHVYISFLSRKKNELLIIISTKDGHTNFKGTTKLGLEALGLTKRAEKYPRTSYLAIIDGGEIIFEELNENDTISFEYISQCGRINTKSSGYYVGRSSQMQVSIKLDDIELATDERGLNFVVINKRTCKILDSVAFDTYWPDMHASRKQ